jgi:hypothetical protein
LDEIKLRFSQRIALDGKTADNRMDVIRSQNGNKLVNVTVVDLDDVAVILAGL